MIKWINRLPAIPLLFGLFIILTALTYFVLPKTPIAPEIRVREEVRQPVFLPAIPLEVQPTSVCQNARADDVKKQKGFTGFYTYTAELRDGQGAYAFVRWNDVDGLRGAVYFDINGVSALPDTTDGLINCLKSRAREVEGLH